MGEFGACSVECAGGIFTRSRSTTSEPSGGGATCGVAEEEATCNTHPCGGEQCELEQWAAWSDCSQSCGSGSSSRSRTVISKPSEDLKCADLSQSRTCNSHSCVTECTVSEWASFEACSATCGGGKQAQERVVMTGDQATCPSLTQERECNTAPCLEPVDCKMSEWSDFTGCSKACDGGSQQRTRSVMVQPQFGAAPCGELADSKQCNAIPCKSSSDCKVSGWGGFSTCSLECGGGDQTRTRSVVMPAAVGGIGCPLLEESRQCNSHGCANPLMASAAEAAA